jgi:hypothetical protein
VGAIQHDGDGSGTDRGAVFIVFLDSNGAILSETKISDSQVNIEDFDVFGNSIAPLGDLAGDGTLALAIGAGSDDDGGLNRGAVWIVFVDSAGAFQGAQKISSTSGGFDGVLVDDDNFGQSVAGIDRNGDGVLELVVGAPNDDDLRSGSTAGNNRGAIWILSLNPTGTVHGFEKISEERGCFDGVLDPSDQFGFEVACIGDLDQNGADDLAVGSPGDDDSGANAGACYALFMQNCGTPASVTEYGTGTPGTLCTPELTMDSPVLSTRVGVTIDNCHSSTDGTTTLVLVGPAQTCLPFAGGKLLVNPPWTIFVIPTPAPQMSFSVIMDCQPALCGSTVFVQGVQHDPTAPGGFYSMTRGLEVTLGGL